MEAKRQVELECPHCGVKNQALVWNIIHTLLNPEDKTALLNGKVNVFTCQKCKRLVIVDKRLLYHDMENKFIAFYLPFKEVQKEDLSKEMTHDGKSKQAEHYEATFRTGEKVDVHYVLDMGELIRYVKFRDAVCDRYKR